MPNDREPTTALLRFNPTAMASSELHGVLLVDKPVGITSFDVIRQLRRTLKTRKIGHAGTLDPFASGLLILCVGDYTRFAGYLTDDDKRYRATVAWGIETNTDDCEGTPVQEFPIPAGWENTLEQLLPRFRGVISQVPPAFSAIHIDGERAYARARKGEEVEIPAREITVHTLDIVETGVDYCVIDVIASKGTYIRALGRDLGRALGMGAHLSALRRTRSGSFDVEDAVSIEQIQHAFGKGDQSLLKTGRDALPAFQHLTLNAEQIEKLQQGKRVVATDKKELGLYTAYAASNDQLIGLVEIVEPDKSADASDTDALDAATRVLKVKRLLPTG